jgi:hypothetical protein
VTTAFLTSRPSAVSAMAFISFSTSAEISGTASTRPPTSTRTALFGPSRILYGITAWAFFTSSEKKKRPMRRFAE